MTANQVKKQLQALGNTQKAEHAQRFFKTGKGQYGEGDLFMGCTVPQVRGVAKAYSKLSLKELQLLLDDPFHDCRLCALVILVTQFQKASEATKQTLVEFYLSNTHRINNWDLVDISAYHILGEWLKNRDRSLLYRLVQSENLWEQRIAVLSTMAFIKEYDFNDTLLLSTQLLVHPHDLIHKACGWMLREVGKRDEPTLIQFLNQYAAQMPRTMLRYAIEKLSPQQRAQYMAVKPVKKRL